MSPGRTFGHGPSLALALGLTLGLLGPRPAHADVVDEAYTAGNAAAQAGRWSEAVDHWQHALELVPGRSAQLDYDLGTAYAQLGELGRATYHLERALQAEAKPDVEVAEAARRNLGIVRRQAEVQAEVSDAQLSRRPSSWDLVVEILAGRALGWFSLISGWLLVGAVGLHRYRRRQDLAASRRGIGRALIWIFALSFVIGGGLHALAIEAAEDHPDAIALDNLVELREGPGAHLPVAFSVQGGSHVRILEQRSGWRRVRLPGGLEGWAKLDSIARLDQPPMRSRVRAASDGDTREP